MTGWTSVDERLPEVDERWDGESWVVVDLGSRYESDSGRFTIMTTVGLKNRILHPHQDDKHLRRPILWMLLQLPSPPEAGP